VPSFEWDVNEREWNWRGREKHVNKVKKTAKMRK